MMKIINHYYSLFHAFFMFHSKNLSLSQNLYKKRKEKNYKSRVKKIESQQNSCLCVLCLIEQIYAYLPFFHSSHHLILRFIYFLLFKNNFFLRVKGELNYCEI